MVRRYNVARKGFFVSYVLLLFNNLRLQCGRGLLAGCLLSLVTDKQVQASFNLAVCFIPRPLLKRASRYVYARSSVDQNT
jgi:hypothetical protein